MEPAAERNKKKYVLGTYTVYLYYILKTSVLSSTTSTMDYVRHGKIQGQ